MCSLAKKKKIHLERTIFIFPSITSTLKCGIKKQGSKNPKEIVVISVAWTAVAPQIESFLLRSKSRSIKSPVLIFKWVGMENPAGSLVNCPHTYVSIPKSTLPFHGGASRCWQGWYVVSKTGKCFVPSCKAGAGEHSSTSLGSVSWLLTSASCQVIVSFLTSAACAWESWREGPLAASPQWWERSTPPWVTGLSWLSRAILGPPFRGLWTGPGQENQSGHTVINTDETHRTYQQNVILWGSFEEGPQSNCGWGGCKNHCLPAVIRWRVRWCTKHTALGVWVGATRASPTSFTDKQCIKGPECDCQVVFLSWRKAVCFIYSPKLTGCSAIAIRLKALAYLWTSVCSGVPFLAGDKSIASPLPLPRPAQGRAVSADFMYVSSFQKMRSLWCGLSFIMYLYST